MAKAKHPSKKIFRISQSFMKDHWDYLNQKLCGYVLEAKYVTNTWPDQPSDAQRLGSIVEYLVSGALPKSGLIPLPEFTKASGVQPQANKGGYKIADLNRLRESLLAPYKKALDNANAILRYLAVMDLEIVSAGDHRVKGKNEGTIDLVVKAGRELKFRNGITIAKGEMFVIDMKYSGLIGDRWSRFGWPLSDEQWTNEQKRYNAFQSRQYHYLSGGMRFFFWVTGSDGAEGKNIGNVALFEITGLDKETIQVHLAEGEKALKDMELFKEIGFTPFPELNRCKDCPLRMACKDKQEYPEPIAVNLGLDMLDTTASFQKAIGF